MPFQTKLVVPLIVTSYLVCLGEQIHSNETLQIDTLNTLFDTSLSKICLFTRNHTLSYTGASVSLATSFFLMRGLCSSERQIDFLKAGTILQTTTPFYFFNWKKALPFTLTELLLYSTQYVARSDGYENYIMDLFLSVAFTDITLYSTYALYKECRLAEVCGGRSRTWDYYNLLQLISSPFSSRNFLHPLSIVFVGIGAAVASFDAPDSTAVWNTGKVYFGNTFYLPASVGIPLLIMKSTILGLFVGVGEESFFRGVIFEELNESLGWWPSTAIDCIIFPLMHISGDKFEGLTTHDIAINFLWRMLLTFGFDYCYKTVGLPLSVTAHSLFDLAFFFVKDLLSSGQAFSLYKNTNTPQSLPLKIIAEITF